MDIQPRGWQAEAVPLLLRTLRTGRPALASVCTGAGKSVMLALVLRDVLATLRSGWAIVVTVPTQALVEQMAQTLRAVLGLHEVGRWYGRRKELRRVTVCCQPSLAGLVAALAEAGQRCALWVGDEAHRAETLHELLGELAPVCRLGMTATPYRSTTGLTMWPETTYRYSMAEALRDGVLVAPEVHVWSGDLGDGADIATLELIRRHADGPGVVSAADIEDCTDYAAHLTAEWGAVEPIHSRLPARRRTALLRQLERGEVSALCHVRVLSEGVDLPWLRWLALRTRHARTRVGLVQELGRVLRTHPGKDRAIVMDPQSLLATLDIRSVGDLIREADRPETAEDRAEAARVAAEDAALERGEEMARSVAPAVAELIRVQWLSLGRDRRVSASDRPSPAQLASLAQRRGATRWLAPEDRRWVRQLIDGAQALSGQQMSDLLTLLSAAGEHARTHREAGYDWRRIPAYRIPVDACAG